MIYFSLFLVAGKYNIYLENPFQSTSVFCVLRNNKRKYVKWKSEIKYRESFSK